jgi:hypothetical protein
MALEGAERQRRISENVAEGHEDDAGDDEDEDDAEPDEHIDRAIGDAVLRQQQRDFQIHALACRRDRFGPPRMSHREERGSTPFARAPIARRFGAQVGAAEAFAPRVATPALSQLRARSGG